jgi:NADPH2:quinone reductase
MSDEEPVKMKAMVCPEIAEGIDHLELRDLPSSDPGPGEVRVRMRAASVNFPDMLMMQGKYQFKPPMPFTPGVEGAGDVVALGEGATQFSVGDRVIVRPTYGAFAEELIVAEKDCRLIPGMMSYEAAAAYAVGSLTAYVALVRGAHLQAGETVLVHGAAGGVGLATVELAKILGATVIATAGSPDKRAVLAARGADHVLDSNLPFRDAITELTGGHGVDVVFDPVGGDIFDQSVKCVAFGGRLLVVGFASGRIPLLSVNQAMLRHMAVIGIRAGEYGRQFPELGSENLAATDALAARGLISPHIHASLPLERTVEAMRMLDDRSVIGKVVVTM